MKKPSRHNKINLRVWKTNGIQTIEGITGVNVYPLAIHRSIYEFKEIQQDFRTRYSGNWHITHIPTGKSFGIVSKEWEDIVYYVENIIDEPALLMVTDKTMTAHPCFSQLSDKHKKLKREIGV